MTDTPETDAALRAIYGGGSAFSFPTHARRMEMERNQWRACAKRLAAIVAADETQRHLAEDIEPALVEFRSLEAQAIIAEKMR